ncbi:helix-turn-helix transcriptional regulator [Paenibacillus agri]|uniref:Helix-turn-helix transcriptional regulator n=1 Tax=Paenibacillus agri TaxID=2744309 RepID=A0A850ER53_9BACL|nr:helix-turn-helix transcriptional regulator [Paenibacillus agri]NUU62260.1 helix-turn-helix transcriptional regulator [Paenibacillus agri]
MSQSLEAFKKELERLERRTSSSHEYREAMISRLKDWIPFDAACCTTVDPYTLLSTGAIAGEGIEAIHARLFEYEYLHEDFNKYDDLVHRPVPVATLSGATEGELGRSGRYLAVLQPAGLGDEIRAALLAGGACWGYLTLFRAAEGSFFFQAAEEAFLAAAAPWIAQTLRRYTLSTPPEDIQGLQEEVGILVLSHELNPIASNGQARKWLSMLGEWEQLEPEILPSPVRAVCSRALAELTAEHQPSKAKICLRLPSGHYLGIAASILDESSGQVQLAVTFEPAQIADILPLIAESYGLSSREKEIVEQISKGLSTKELAHNLHISTYTVQDHLKSIFTKTRVTSRRELIWRLFSRYSSDKKA